MYIRFDGETYAVDKVNDYGWPMIEIGKMEYYIFLNRTEAGEVAREYWKDMADSDASEFTCMVGEQTLISWALGQSAGPGYTAVNSLSEWLDLWLDEPEGLFASYDGEEVDAQRISPRLADELGFPIDDYTNMDIVIYRHN